MADASRTGMLVWAPARTEQMQFAWFDRTGRRLSTLAIEPGDLYEPRLSPDGRTLAFYRAEKGGAEIMLHDLATGATRRVSQEPGYNQAPAWLPDGRGIVFVGDAGLTRLFLDGSSASVTIFKQRRDIDLPAVTPDGRFVVIPLGGSTRGRILWAIELRPPYTATQLLATSGEQTNCRMSPDGRWLLWGSSDGGRQETYLARFTADGGTPRLGAQRILVASNSSAAIGWRSDGREIYDLDQNRDVTAVPITLQPDSAALGPPVKLFSLPLVFGDRYLPTVTPDGSRFIVSETPFQDTSLRRRYEEARNGCIGGSRAHCWGRLHGLQERW